MKDGLGQPHSHIAHALPAAPEFRHAVASREGGFTLIELLVVMGIILLLVAALVPAVTSLTKSNNINTAGRMVSNVLTVARSDAINRRALIRFEVATSWPGDPDAAYRKFTLVQHDLTSGADTQLTKWETLPSGVIFNPQDVSAPPPGSYFFLLNQVQTPALTSGTQTIPTVYIEFLPTGALNVAPLRWAQQIPMGKYNLPETGNLITLPPKVVIRSVDELNPRNDHESNVSIASPTPPPR